MVCNSLQISFKHRKMRDYNNYIKKNVHLVTKIVYKYTMCELFIFKYKIRLSEIREDRFVIQLCTCNDFIYVVHFWKFFSLLLQCCQKI